MRRWRIDRLMCWIGEHDWTCKSKLGIAPEPDEPFFEYAAMLCKRCSYRYHGNQSGGPSLNEIKENDGR